MQIVNFPHRVSAHMPDQPMTAKHPTFIEAIHKKQRLSCTYHGKPRIIEPQAYGVGRPGRELVRVHQRHELQPGEQREPLFYASDIENARVVGTFTQPGPHYTRDDSAMVVIFAQL